MSKRILTLVLALVMVLSLAAAPLSSLVAFAAEGPVVIKVHYTREDGNYSGWDVFSWGSINGGGTAFVEGDGEAVATLYANANTSSIGFIVRYGGDAWTDREWVNSNTGDRLVQNAYPELSLVQSGTIHLYVDHANPTVTTAVEGDDVVKGEPVAAEPTIAVKFHYSRPDGDYEGWDVYAWENNLNGVGCEFVEEDGEMVATYMALANPWKLGFLVRKGGDSWTDKDVGVDRMLHDVNPDLDRITEGTIHVYITSGEADFTIELGDDVVMGAIEEVDAPITIKVHYYRPDQAYSDWEVHMWNGPEGIESTRPFVERDENGWAVATYWADTSAIWVGFIIKKPDWTKDPDGDRQIDLTDVLGGTVHVYAETGSSLEDFIVDKSEAVTGVKITSAIFDHDTGCINVTTSAAVTGELAEAFTMTGPDGAMTITSATEGAEENTYVIAFEGELNDAYKYYINLGEITCKVTMPILYSRADWEAEFTYTGNDLGATYTSSKTTFRLWAPTASAVAVKLYTTGSDNEAGAAALGSYAMTKDVNGTWIVTIEGDLKNVYYTYAVTRSGETVEACDPYAKAAGVNGNRAMVIDLDSTDPEGWADDTYVTVDNYTDAVIWELHVRDFSIDASSGITEANKGKYLAFTETGTTVNGEGKISTGIDYMADLGVNYVHLLPVYDINSVDETKGGYNWGYDPKNYNVPEGSYSTNPYDGNVRVNEFKQMVKSLHDHDIGVVMDVVYNHVADGAGFCFNQIVPGYFSRIHDDGSYQSNSGCGNDTASERSMVSKYIVDSVLYWAEEYHIDGFRWDLVGLIDYDTINDVMAAVHEVNPNIIFYGEGWEMCSWTTKEGYVNKMTIQNNDDKVNTEAGVFAFFNDTIRNAIHGGVFTATDKGFVSGGMTAATKQTITDAYMANSTWGSANGTVDTPLQTVNYGSCHDNYTLFDNLTIDAMAATGLTAAEVADQAAAMNNLAAAYYITAQGVPFIHAGEEMLRSKPDATQEHGFHHNTFSSGDAINSIKWGALETELVADTHDYYKGLIAFRAAHPALRMTSEAEVLAAMSALETGSNDVVAILNKGGNGEDAEILSIFNAASSAQTVTLPAGTWDVYVTGTEAGTTVIESVKSTVEVPATSAMILIKGEDVPAQIPTLKLEYPSLSFESEVFYNVYFSATNTADVVELGLLTWNTRPEETEDAVYETADAVINGAAYNDETDVYMVRSEGVPAKKLADTLYMRVYAKLSDGTYAYSQLTYYSAKFYAADIFGNSKDDDMKALCVAMLNYGSAAQVYFDYNADDLMNSVLGASQKAMVKEYSADMIEAIVTADPSKVGSFKSNGGFTRGYPSVSFEAAFSINYYLTPKNAVDGDMTLYCWDLDTYNSVDELTEDNATTVITMTEGEIDYVGIYEGIAAKKIDETIFVAGVYTSNGVRYSSPVISYSLAAYCAEQIANGSDVMKDLAKATAVYGYYAEAYFNK